MAHFAASSTAARMGFPISSVMMRPRRSFSCSRSSPRRATTATRSSMAVNRHRKHASAARARRVSTSVAVNSENSASVSPVAGLMDLMVMCGWNWNTNACSQLRLLGHHPFLAPPSLNALLAAEYSLPPRHSALSLEHGAGCGTPLLLHCRGVRKPIFGARRETTL